MICWVVLTQWWRLISPVFPWLVALSKSHVLDRFVGRMKSPQWYPGWTQIQPPHSGVRGSFFCEEWPPRESITSGLCLNHIRNLFCFTSILVPVTIFSAFSSPLLTLAQLLVPYLLTSILIFSPWPIFTSLASMSHPFFSQIHLRWSPDLAYLWSVFRSLNSLWPAAAPWQFFPGPGHSFLLSTCVTNKQVLFAEEQALHPAFPPWDTLHGCVFTSWSCLHPGVFIAHSCSTAPSSVWIQLAVVANGPVDSLLGLSDTACVWAAPSQCSQHASH